MMNLVRRLVGTKNDRELKRLVPYVERINQLEPALAKLSDAALAARTADFKQRLANGEPLDLQVNMLAEQELTAILGLLNEIGARVGVDPRKADPEVEHLAQETDVRTIATAIEENLNDQPLEVLVVEFKK
jgi:hypothetical protein